MKIIAESAFNHNGSIDYLFKLAEASKKAGADYFTVQLMNVDAFCTADYEKYELYKSTEFSENQWRELFDYCKQIDLALIPCVLEEKSFDFAYSHGFRLLKIHATDISNVPFLKYIAQNNDVKIILETQCATLFEVQMAIDIIKNSNIEALFTGYSNYPSEVEELNLNVIDYFKNKFGLSVGFADHSLDTHAVPLMILAKGAKYIEKHITLSRNDRHYDWQVSLYPNEFATMVSAIKHYELALGRSYKHPTENEKKFRSIMYKKVQGDNTLNLKRANLGQTFIENKIKEFNKDKVIVALIARLKSQRLTKKVLLPLYNNELIVDLYNRISTTKSLSSVVLATSDLEEDFPLVEIFRNKNLKTFRGDALSVIDRMLSLAIEEEASAIFRVTGDNPFTDPLIMEDMITLMKDYNLDYVKVNNVPFGVGAELFSTEYLWRLYLAMEDTMVSEYLTWFVLNDPTVRIGSIDLVYDKQDVSRVNLSVDYQEDYDRCLRILEKVKKESFQMITLKDVLENISNDDFESIDVNKEIKLPKGESIKLIDYLNQFENKSYVVRKIHELK